MTSFNLTIRLGNDAMGTHEDIADALENVIRGLRFFYQDSGSIIDLNGNTVGDWKISND